MVKLQYGFLCLGYFVTGRYSATIQDAANLGSCFLMTSAHIATFGDVPAKWTVYCVQFPRSRTFHLDTAAWNCHTRVDIPWQQLPHPVVFTAAPIPFHCTNPNCIWFAVPYGPKGQYLICHRFIGMSWVVEQASCNTRQLVLILSGDFGILSSQQC